MVLLYSEFIGYGSFPKFLLLRTAPHPLQPFEYTAAGTLSRQYPASILCPIANHGHSLLQKRCHNDFSHMTVLHREAGCRVDDLIEQTGLPDMITVKGGTAHSSCQTRFGHAVMLIDPTIPNTGDSFPCFHGHIFRSQQNTAEGRCKPCQASFRRKPGHSSNDRGRPHQRGDLPL